MISYDIRNGIKKIRTRASLVISGITLGVAGLVLAVAIPLAAKADTPTQVVVTPPLNSQGWSTASTNADGTVSFNADTTAPGNPHNGALQLITDAASTAKAQYLYTTDTPLTGVTQLSYYTKQNSPVGLIADPSYELAICATGATTTGCNPNYLTSGSSFTTLVYEPYQGGQGAIVNGVWQSWDVSSGGLFWSTHTVVCSNGTLVGTPSGGPATITLAQVQSACPNALVFQFGVNIGSNNPSYSVETDLFNFNGTTYNFEPFNEAINKDQCKDGGWQNVTDNNGNSFKNQGDCVSFVATGGKSQGNSQ